MQASAKQKTERWFKCAIGFGAFTALALLVNSVANYAFVSRLVLEDHIRHDLAAQTSVLDQQLRAAEPEDTERLVNALYRRGLNRLAWVQLRDAEDRVIAHAGLESAPVFPMEELRKRLRQRKPAYRTMATPAGEVVVEAFALRLRPAGARVQPTLFRTIANENEPKPTLRGGGVVEIAAYVNAVDAVFWPIRRNLIINVTAALALLVALGVMAWRFRAYLAGLSLEQQVADAGEVQRDLVAAPSDLSTDFVLAAEYSPANAVGGDFYDAFALDHGKTAFVMGDVSGKGVPAALLMGVIHGAVRSSVWSGTGRDHASATATINRLLCEKAARSRYASMFWSYFDKTSGTLAYVNAGHFAPLLFRMGARVPVRLEEGGPVLGLLSDASYRQGTIGLEPGDTLVLYSDGIVEAASPLGEMFGEERLMEAILEGGAPESIRERVLGDVRRFARTEEDGDDRTLVVIRYQPQAVAARLAA